MKKTIIMAAVVAVLVLVTVTTVVYRSNLANKEVYVEAVGAASSKDVTYVVDSKAVTIKNGVSEQVIADSVTKTITRYTGNSVKGDLNGDGKEDMTVVMTQETGGSGVFYYIAAALTSGAEINGLNTVLLGDRILLKSTEIKDGKIFVTFLERKVDEAMTVAPSVEAKKSFQVVSGLLTDITESSQVANPASINCLKVGGNISIEKRGDGGEYGLCNFEDNRACEEWALLHGDCPIGGRRTTGFDNITQKYCAWFGGSTLATPDSVCILKNGAKCTTEEFYNGSEKCTAPLVLDNLAPGQSITSPMTITGTVIGTWFFEASFPIKLYDSNNKLIVTTIGKANVKEGETWMTEKPVNFTANLIFNRPTGVNGTIVFERDNPSGLSGNDAKMSLPIKFSPEPETTKLKVYFNNNKLDPAMSCNKVFSVERKIAKTQAVARAALTELLAGVNFVESEAGYFSNIGKGVTIQKLSITNGVAKVDFSKQLEEQSGGSCRVAAIIAQINQTLKQFSTVKSVIISIDGRADDILQP